MSEQAAVLSREAQSLYQGLKELLQKHRDPWDKETDFQRKNLRRRYLTLLLVHPYARESKDAETHLWMQTSHAFIAVYKSRLTTLDRQIHAPRPPQQQQQSRQAVHGPVEYRKLMQRFRQFLADEEKFWTQLLVRLHRSFDLGEAQSALETLKILPATDEISSGITIPDGAAGMEGTSIAVANGRNHFQFPPEDGAISVVPATIPDRESRLAILSKALVCLGDIARYRELYNESGGRPKAGYEDNIPARKNARNKRGGAPVGSLMGMARPRNYEKAQECYLQARSLVPYEGNPSHQLAILSTYQKDYFMALLHYYRALCVRQPYDTASENLASMLTKYLETWKSKKRKEDRYPGSLPVPIRIDTLQEKTVVLHALWRLGTEKMDSISPNHAQEVFDEFKALVSERHLLIDVISKFIVLSQGALWKHRMIREPVSNNRKGEGLQPPISLTAVESRIFLHVLSLHQAILEVGRAQLEEIDISEKDLAQRITATFRRSLPALRIASKWLRANFKYAIQRQDYDEVETRTVAQFWSLYTRFSTELARAFPESTLPSFVLEEDIEMRGFLPLRKLMGEEYADGSAPAIQQVHPNEEQLMRIYDILQDAKILAATENSPMKLYSNQESVVPINQTGDNQAITAPQQALLTSIRDNGIQTRPVDSDNMTETTSCTDDDPIRAAFKQALSSDRDTDEEDDQIVWDPRPTITPAPTTPSKFSSPPSRATPITPMKPVMSPIGSSRASSHPMVVSPLSPLQPLPVSAAPMPASASTSASGTTAQDLLNGVLSGIRPRAGSNGLPLAQTSALQSTAPQPQLLFGSGPPNRPGHSIWSASLDDRPLKLPNTANGNLVPHNNNNMHSSHSAQHQFSPAVQNISAAQQPMDPNVWSAQYTNSQNLNIAPGHLPSAAFTPSVQFQSLGHHRAISASNIGQNHHLAQTHMGQQPHIYATPSNPNHGPSHGLIGHEPFSPAGYSQQQLLQQQALAVNNAPFAANVFYGQGPPVHDHVRHMPLRDLRAGQTAAAYMPKAAAQQWGHAG